MPIYIAYPKPGTIAKSFNLSTRKLTSEHRKHQVEEVTALHKENGTYQSIKDWVKKTQSEGELRCVKEPNNPGVTGTVLVETKDAIAERMKKDLPNAFVLKDTPIKLIEPQRDKVSGKPDIDNEDLWHLEAIGLNEARANGFSYSGQGVTIAVLDTGIDSTHPELVGKVTSSYRFNGDAWKVYREKRSSDLHGHGTHVAGLICGERVGISPKAKLVNVLALSQPQGTGNLSDFLLALDWVASRSDIQIVNISAGIPAFIDELEVVIKSLLSVGVFPICAVGNEGRDYTSSPGNCRGTLSVGASTRDELVWGNSGSGQIVISDRQVCNVPSLVAPGKDVYSSVMGGYYEAWNGTSMATPIVSGVAALILEADPFISVGELREKLLRQCYKLPKESDIRQGAGLVRIDHAAAEAKTVAQTQSSSLNRSIG